MGSNMNIARECPGMILTYRRVVTGWVELTVPCCDAKPHSGCEKGGGRHGSCHPVGERSMRRDGGTSWEGQDGYLGNCARKVIEGELGGPMRIQST